MLRMMVFAFAIGGRNILADSYQLAYLIPSTIYEFIAGGLLSAVFIPLLVREQEEHGKSSRQAWNVANLLLGAVGLFLALAGLIGCLLAPWIIQGLTAMGSDAHAAEKQALATHMFRYFSPQIFFLGVNAVFMAILNSLGVFAVTGAVPIINNIVVIGVFIAYYLGAINVTGLAVGTTLGTVAMILIQLPWLWKAGMKIRPQFNLRHDVFKSVANLGWPIILVSIANLVGWVIRTNLLATALGALAIYAMCFQIIMVPYGIFAVAIATVLYPTLSRHAANHHQTEFVNDMTLGFRWTAFIMLPVSIGIAMLALPVIRLLFEHRGGQFQYSDSLFAGQFLAVYALSIAPYSLVMFATRVFYSVKDTLTPAIINIGGVAINAIISFALLKTMGVIAIALAAAVTYALTTAISLTRIRKVTGSLGGTSFWLSMLKIGAASVVMAVALQAAISMTRPQSVIIESGTRLNIPVPQPGLQGNITAIHSPQDFKRTWSALGNLPETTPKIDFDRNTILLAWGPLSKTTSTLQFEQITLSDSTTEPLTVKARIESHSRTGNLTSDQDAVTSPAYALIQVRRPHVHAFLELHVGSTDDSTQPFARHGDSEILRLLFLSLFGAVVYLVTAYLFKMPELEALSGKVLERFRRRNRDD